jgi:hypothetical protein
MDEIKQVNPDEVAQAMSDLTAAFDRLNESLKYDYKSNVDDFKTRVQLLPHLVSNLRTSINAVDFQLKIDEVLKMEV